MGLKIKCNKCGHEFKVNLNKTDFNWSVDSTSEREMGTERCWLSTVTEECPSCNTEFNIEFYVWEYPEGVFNYSSVESDNAKILNELSLEKYIDLQDTPNNG